MENLTPKQIVAELDKYIIGQGDAKRNVAIALRNRWRRMNVKGEIKNDIIPNNILLIGSTGVGKTEIARRLAKIADAPFTKVEASKFTEVGYVGRDVESMVRDLVEQAVNMVRTQKKTEVKAKAEAIVENIILDALIPPLKGKSFPGGDAQTDMTDHELNQKTREKFREKIQKGRLDDRKIEIDIKAAASGLLSAEIRENFIGYATIKEVFKVTGVGKVAGCMVTEGVARRSAGVRLLRDNVVIHEGTLKTLKRFKDEVADVKSGYECGMAFERYEDIRADDVIEIFEREEIVRTLD